MGNDGLMLLFVIGLVAIIALIRYFVPKITNKAGMAVRNKIVQYEEKKNPPQKMNLADLYGGQAQSSSENGAGEAKSVSAASPKVCPNCGKVLKPGSNFCPSCGTKTE